MSLDFFFFSFLRCYKPREQIKKIKIITYVYRAVTEKYPDV